MKLLINFMIAFFIVLPNLSNAENKTGKILIAHYNHEKEVIKHMNILKSSDSFKNGEVEILVKQKNNPCALEKEFVVQICIDKNSEMHFLTNI